MLKFLSKSTPIDYEFDTLSCIYLTILEIWRQSDVGMFKMTPNTTFWRWRKCNVAMLTGKYPSIPIVQYFYTKL